MVGIPKAVQQCPPCRWFFLLLMIIFAGFAVAFAVLLGPDGKYEDVAIKLFTVMMADFQWDYITESILHQPSGVW